MKVDVLSNEVFFLKLAECLNLVNYEVLLPSCTWLNLSVSLRILRALLLNVRGVSTLGAPSRGVYGFYPC